MKTALLILMTASSVLASGYPVVVPRFEAAVKAEMREWEIGGIATAWVDGTKIVYEAGYGEAQKDSVFRCGSVSKLFNAIAVMQQVEAGKLDLDAPVEKYLPGVMPINPFVGSPPVTLRHLLSHRSGLQRESSVGSYFDPDEPGILKSIASLRGNALITAPNAKTRYSNIAPTLAGHCVEVVTSLDYETYQAKHVLGPLGMTHSAWRHASLPNGAACLKSHMRMADGKGAFPRKETPLFDLGTIPAGNLFTTAGDLARFIASLSAEGTLPGHRVLAKETLTRMFQPQHDEKGAFGIGFALGELEGRKTVGHGGAVYGHSTQLIYLPEEKIGVVVLANEDIVNGRTSRLAALALQLMLEARWTGLALVSTYTKGSAIVTMPATFDLCVGDRVDGSAFIPATTINAILDDKQCELSSPAQVSGSDAITFRRSARAQGPGNEKRVSEKPASLADYAGDYESQSYWAELRVEGAELRGNFSSQPCVFVPVKGDTFILRSRIHADVPVDFTRDATGKVTSFNALPQVFQRVPAKRPQAPPSWSALYGSYGPDFIPLVVFEKFGHLYASTENMVDYRLTPITRHVFSMPPGMYIDEHVVFHINESGNVIAAEHSSMMLPRRK